MPEYFLLTKLHPNTYSSALNNEPNAMWQQKLTNLPPATILKTYFLTVQNCKNNFTEQKPIHLTLDKQLSNAKRPSRLSDGWDNDAVFGIICQSGASLTTLRESD
jgi:hypothetical protein